MRNHDARRKHYQIKYEDGDEEELIQDGVRRHLTPPTQDTTIRYKRVEQKYWTEEQSGRRRSPRIQKLKGFTGGYANAVENLSQTWYNWHESSNQEYKNYANSVIDKETGKKMEYKHLIKHPKFKKDWLKSGANEFYRLFQGSKKKMDGTQRIEGTNTLFWVKKEQVPKNKKVTYTRVYCDVRPEKEEIIEQVSQ